MVELTIFGEPCAQGRGRAGAVMTKRGPLMVNGRPVIKVRDPEKSRSWKSIARDAMQRAIVNQRPSGSPLPGPLAVEILAAFTLPASAWRKRAPVPRQWHTKRGDADNIAKAALDAALGIVWFDDAQVASLHVHKIIAAQGEAPFLRMRVFSLEASEVPSEGLSSPTPPPVRGPALGLPDQSAPPFSAGGAPFSREER